MTNATPELPAVPGSIPFVHNADTAPAYQWLDILWTILVRGEDTGGRYSLMYEALPEGSGAPPHRHTWSDEHFDILDGEFAFPVGDEINTSGKGVVFLPRNTCHAFRVDSETAAFLNGYTPAGLELAVAEMTMPASSRTLPPKGATPPPTTMTSDLMRRYGMDNVPGPNPLNARSALRWQRTIGGCKTNLKVLYALSCRLRCQFFS